MNNFFKTIDPNIPKNRQKAKMDQILHMDENPELYIVTDSVNTKQISFFSKLLKNEYGRNVNFALIYCFTYRPTDTDLKKNLTEFVYKYSTKYEKIIPPNSKVLIIGRSIYTFTKETYLTASAFYSYLYNKTYFYHPDTKSYLFPVDSLYKIFSYSEKRIIDAFEYFFLKKQIELSRKFNPPKLRLPQIRYEVVENPNEFLKSYIGIKMKVAWDLETSGFIFYKNEIICITMSFDGKVGYYLPWEKVDVKVLNEFFKDKYQIGANLKFDCRFLRSRGVSNARIDFDTLNAGHCLNETASNTLGAHGWMYTYNGGHEIELHHFLKTHPKLKNFALIPRSILSRYAAFDAVICYQTQESQKKLLEEDPQLNAYYFNEVVPNLNLFLNIEMDGVFIDWKYLKQLGIDFNNKRSKLEKEIYALLGFEVSLTSSKDLPLALEHKAKLPDIGLRGKNGLYLTNEEAMKTWSKLGFEVANKILQYKSLCTQINTFIGDEKKQNAYWEYKNKIFVHPTYSVMLAKSHRNKCNGPNLQQVPKKTESAPIFRKIFTPPDMIYNDEIKVNDSIILELDNDEILEISNEANCKIIRDSEEIIVKAKDLKENDEFLKEV